MQIFCIRITEILKIQSIFPNRNDVQKKVLDDINMVCKNNFAASFLITLGYEFQGLMLNSDNIIKMDSGLKSRKFQQKLTLFKHEIQ